MQYDTRHFAAPIAGSSSAVEAQLGITGGLVPFGRKLKCNRDRASFPYLLKQSVAVLSMRLEVQALSPLRDLCYS